MKKKIAVLFGVLFALILPFTAAACGKVSLKLTFKVDGVDYATISTSGDEVIKMPENPTKDGYVFDGWFWDEGTWQKPFTANSLLDTPLSSDMSVYAKFTANADAPPTGTEIRSNLFTQNGEVYSTVVPNRDSVFSFNDKIQVADGATWALYDNIRCVNEIISRATEIEAGDNIFYVLVINGNARRQYTFNVRRRPIYTVNFKSDGPHIASQQVEEGNLATEPVGVTRVGYEFDGWSFDFSQPIISHTEIGVRWKAIDYDISYSLDGGEFKTDYAGKYTIENEIKLATPEKLGYDFAGWYENGKTTPTAKIAKGTFGNKTFTAKWNAHEYDINYVLGGGTNSSNNPTKYTIESDDITLSEPFYINADFNGWKCTINGKDAPNVAESGVIPKGTVGDIEFTAMWNEFEVKLEDVSDGYAVVGRNIEKSEIVIAPSYHGKNVTEIKDRAFYNCSDLTSITIGCNVTSIGSYAFNGCSSLTSVKIPNKVETIGAGAFGGCNGLTDIEFGENVTSIGNFAFEECVGLTSVAIPNKVAVIGESAFGGCIELKEVSIPDSLTSIGENAFGDCPIETAKMPTLAIPSVAGAELKTVEITSGDSIAAGAFNGCDNLTSIIIPDSVESIEAGALKDCIKLESITIPFIGANKSASNGYDCVFGYIFGYETREFDFSYSSTCDSTYGILQYGWRYPNEVEKGCYYYYKIPLTLKTVILSDAVEVIPYKAFRNCKYTQNIDIGDGVTSIKGYAFENCSSLISIIIPDGVTSIGEYAFSGCSNLSRVTISNKVRYVYNYAFYKCSRLTSVYITDLSAWCNIYFGNEHSNPIYSTGYAGGLYLHEKLVTDLVIPDDVTVIRDYTFYRCIKLSSLKIPDNVNIGNSAFYGCSIKTAEIPASGIQGIPKSQLETVIITSGESIEANAFENCSKLVSVSMPADVTTIGSCAFRYCSSLTSITIPDSVTSIGNYAFEDCGKLVYKEYDNAKYLGNMDNPYLTLIKCKSSDITSCNISEKTRFIHSSAFESCSRLTSIKIPNSITIIGSCAFRYCRSLTSITIPDSVTSIESYAFYDCSGLTDIAIGNDVTSIGNGAFSGCSSLMSVTIPDSVTSIGTEAFYNCSGLTDIAIGNSVTSIGGRVFEGCSSLTSITIPDSVTSVGYGAFKDCSKLATVYYKGSAQEWNNISINKENNGNECLTSATRYYYSETEPALNADGTAYDGNFWYYDENGVPTVWKKQN